MIYAENPLAVTKECKHPVCLNSLKKLKAQNDNSRYVTVDCEKCDQPIEHDVDLIIDLCKEFGICFDAII